MQSRKDESKSQSTPTRTNKSSRARKKSNISPPSATLSDQSSTTNDLISEFEDIKISQNSENFNNPRSFPYSVKQQCWEKADKVKGRDPNRWRRDPLGNTIFRKLVGCPGCLCHDYDHILPYSKPSMRRDPLGNTIFRKLVGCPGCLCHDYDHILPYSKPSMRRDPLGNTIFRKLVGCPGCLCHDYDHILPYSKGGKSTLDNCQVLQATVNRSKGNRTDISRADLIQKSSYCRVSGRDMDLLELSAYGNVRRGGDSGGCRIQ